MTVKRITPELKEVLMSMAPKSKRKRVVGEREIDRFIEVAEAVQDSAKSIRVYSRGGFVANSYNWRATIQAIHAEKRDDGEWSVGIVEVDAKRPHGSGALVTVNSRGYYD